MNLASGEKVDIVPHSDPNPLPAGVVFVNPVSGIREGSASPPTEHSRLVQGLLSVGASMFLRLFLGFTSLIIAARILTTDEFGVYFLMMTLMYMLEVLGDFGLRMSVSRFIASADTDEERRTIVNAVFGFRLLSLIPIALLAVLLKPLLMLLFPSDLLSALFLYVPIMFLVDQMEGTCADIMQGYHMYRKTAIVRALTGVLSFVFVLLFLPVMALGAEGMVLAYVLSVGIAVLLRLVMIPGPKRVIFDWPRTKRILKFGVQLQGNDILTFLFGRIDVLMLGSLLGAGQIAFLEVGARIPGYFQQLYQAVNAVYLPHMSGLFSHNKEAEATDVLNGFLRLAAFIMLGCALALILFGREVVLIVFDETYLPSVPVLGMMMVVITISLLSTIMDIALVSAGKPIYLLFINGVMMVATIVADVTLIPAFGLMGVVTARLVANLVANPVSFYYVRKIGLNVDIIAVLRPVVIFGAILATYFALDVDGFLLKVALLGVYPALCVVVSAITADEIVYFLRTFQRQRTQAKLAVEL